MPDDEQLRGWMKAIGDIIRFMGGHSIVRNARFHAAYT